MYGVLRKVVETRLVLNVPRRGNVFRRVTTASQRRSLPKILVAVGPQQVEA